MDTNEELEKLRAINKHSAQMLAHAESDLAYAVSKAATRAREAEAARDDAISKLRTIERQTLKQVIDLVTELKDNDFLSGDKSAMIALDLVNSKIIEKLQSVRG